MSRLKVISQVFASEGIQGRRVYRLILPERTDAERLPLVTLLHGVHGAEIDWMEQGYVLDTLSDLLESRQIAPMAILMPSDGLTGIGTGYLDWAAGPPHCYEHYLLKELIPEVESRFDVGGTRTKRSVAGLSMGGYAAVRFGLVYPDYFSVVSSLSGFFDVRELGNLIGREHFSRIFYDDAQKIDEASPLYMTIRRESNMPVIHFDCGTEDRYLEVNRSMHRRLTERNIDHTYMEYSGSHTWEYWSDHIRDHLIRHNEVFRKWESGCFVENQ